MDNFYEMAPIIYTNYCHRHRHHHQCHHHQCHHHHHHHCEHYHDQIVDGQLLRDGSNHLHLHLQYINCQYLSYQYQYINCWYSICLINIWNTTVQIVDGQLLRDGPNHLHPNSRLGLQSFLSSLQKVQRLDKLLMIIMMMVVMMMVVVVMMIMMMIMMVSRSRSLWQYQHGYHHFAGDCDCDVGSGESRLMVFQGMFFHPEDRGEMASMIYNWPADEVFSVTSITNITIW